MTEKETLLSHPLNFPEMHPELVANCLPENIFFLDPGLNAKDRDARYWPIPQPELDKNKALSSLSDLLQMGERFAEAGGLNYFAQAGLEDFYEHTSLAIRSELSQIINPDQDKAGQTAQSARLRSQILLLLDWALEERLTEFNSLQEQVHKTWTQLSQDLGIEKEDERFAYTADLLPTPQGLGGTMPVLPWESILEAFLCFIPEESTLFTTNNNVLESIQRQGHELVELPGKDYLTFRKDKAVEGEKILYSVYQPGWVLAAKDELPAQKPWLSKNISIIFFQ